MDKFNKMLIVNITKHRQNQKKSSFRNMWCGEDIVIFKSPYCVILIMYVHYVYKIYIHFI